MLWVTQIAYYLKVLVTCPVSSVCMVAHFEFGNSAREEDGPAVTKKRYAMNNDANGVWLRL